jgi:NADH-quinone oxidoreductase subunit N
MDDAGVASVMIYFFMYMVMNLGAFYVVALIANNIGSEEIDDYNGLGYRAPILGICMTLFLISLTGLPPTAGFIGKLYVFSAVVKAGYIWLAVVGVINSVISLFYYVKIFRNMYLNDVDSIKSKLTYSPASIVLLFVFAIPTLYLGIFFNEIVKWASYSANIFMGK